MKVKNLKRKVQEQNVNLKRNEVDVKNKNEEDENSENEFDFFNVLKNEEDSTDDDGEIEESEAEEIESSEKDHSDQEEDESNLSDEEFESEEELQNGEESGESEEVQSGEELESEEESEIDEEPESEDASESEEEREIDEEQRNEDEPESEEISESEKAESDKESESEKENIKKSESDEESENKELEKMFTLNNKKTQIKTEVWSKKRKEKIKIKKLQKTKEIDGSKNKLKQNYRKSSLNTEKKGNKLNKISKANSNEGKKIDEYAEYDTSDEEDIRNTVGNIPKNWYDDYKHLGYDWDGKQIIKPPAGDQLDEFLKRVEDPDFWRTVKDPQTGQDVVLSEEDIKLIRRIQSQKIPDETFDEYAPWIEWFTSEVMKTPIRKFPEHKRSFLPSKSEEKKVSKLVHALKMGWIKTKAEQDKLRAKKEPQFYMLWQTDDQAEEMRRIHKHIPAPKRHLPGHAESYNPPPEYLFDSKELKQWNKHKTTPWKRKLHFVPQKYDSLRKVPAYSRYIKERFLRCLDLYLCPRAVKMRLTIEPEDLVPKLPSPRDLQPFPTVLAINYEGHTDMVRAISVDKFGQYLVSGSDDTTIKIWEVNTGRCIKTIETGGIVHSVEWCPNTSISLVLVASGSRALLINPHVGDFLVCNKTDEILKEIPQTDLIISERIRSTVQWEQPNPEEYKLGIRLVLKHFKEVKQVTWHGKGDYFASVMPDGQNRSVLISQLSKRRSQIPFTKSKGLIQCILFHPIKPFLFVATQRNVRIYDLVKQGLIKKLYTNCKWISKMAVHPGGDNLLVGTYDRKMLWFDMDLSTKPYQTLRLHGTAVRGVAYHKRYPLFASGSDDRNLIVSHGMVYNDLLQNPLIVPLKRLQDHEPKNDFGIFDVIFHPLQPWVFSAGADGTIKLYSN